MDADEIVRDGLVSITGWVGFSVGLPVTFTVSPNLPVEFSVTPEPLDRLERSWFAGNSLYFTIGAGLLWGKAFTLLIWDLEILGERYNARAMPKTWDDATTYFGDFGLTFTAPPLAWSYA